MSLTTNELLYMLIYGTAGDATFAREALSTTVGHTFGPDVVDDLWRFRMMVNPQEQAPRSAV
jgi:hypothetical protein